MTGGYCGQPTVRCDLCCKIREDGQLPHDVRGAADRCWVCQKSESKRKRWSASKGTREARLSRVAAWLNRFTERGKQLPMRQSGGGASVVVGDVNDDHMAKGRRMIRSGQQKCSLHLESF